MRVKCRDHRPFVSALKCDQQVSWDLRIRGSFGHLRVTTLFVSDDGDDVGVSTFGGNREGTRGVTVRPNTLARVGAVLHQEANYFRPPLQYRMVERPMLIVFSHIQVDQLRTHHEHRPHALDVIGAHGVAESADRAVMMRRSAH
jgi:hypothetical protein